jgi:hypothetical protein
MSGTFGTDRLAAGIDSLGALPPRKPPPDPGDVTTRKELADAIGHIMRGMSSPIGGPSRKDRIGQILAACDAYAAVQIAAAITPSKRM